MYLYVPHQFTVLSCTHQVPFITTHTHTHTTHPPPHSQRWWPCEVIHPSSIPDNILSKKPGKGMFVVRFCGSQDFAWSYHGRTVPYTENYDIVTPHRKQKTTDAAFKKGNYTCTNVINNVMCTRVQTLGAICERSEYAL